MSKKQTIKERQVPLKCPDDLCRECWRDEELFVKHGITQCIYGGPFKGYKYVK